MGKLISLSYKQWQRYEAGEAFPGGEVLQSLANLGFNINWILTGIGDMRLPQGEIKNTIEVNEGRELYTDVAVNQSAGSTFELITDLAAIMESDDEGTKVAIAQNIKMFRESVRRKKLLDRGVELKDFKEQKI